MKRIIWIVLIAVTALSIAPAASAGQFKKAGYYKLGDQQEAFQVISAEFTHSGNLDLAVADYLSSEVSILLGNGNGTFQKAITFPAPAPIALAAGDLNGTATRTWPLSNLEGRGTVPWPFFWAMEPGIFGKRPPIRSA
jgi:hypothetical protein